MIADDLDTLFHNLANNARLDISGTQVPLHNKSTDIGLSVTQKHLPKEFIGRGEVRGFLFRQIAESTKGYLHEVTIPGGPIHYEVFRRSENKRFVCISYPSSKRFGLIAWTFRTLDQAQNKFKEIVNGINRNVKEYSKTK